MKRQEVDPRRVRTAPIQGNQERIDEFEYFIEGIGRYLFGSEGEDFRLLAGFAPRTRNLSALVELGRQAGRDVADDLAFIYGELEAHARKTAPVVTPRYRADAVLFHYRRYAEVLAHPERLLEHVEPARRLEVVNLISRGVAEVAPLLARVNAYAWIAVVGVPDLELELEAKRAPAVELRPHPERADEALERILATAKRRAGQGLRQYVHAVYRTLNEDYRSQIARLGGGTEPLRA